MKTIYKYLHVEIIHGQLYVYRGNAKHGGKLITGKEIDAQCGIDCENDNTHKVFEIADLISGEAYA